MKLNIINQKEEVNEMKSCLLEKIKKISKTLDRATKTGGGATKKC